MKAPLINDLKARRETLGWSVKDVGKRCGIDATLLNDWERGIGSPRLDAVETWASALGVKLAFAEPEQDARRGVRIDWDGRCITVDGAPVRLTPMEWKALERLARIPGELVTHQDLFRHLYGEEQLYRAQSTAIRVLITKLRRLLPVRIEARWGRGYVVSGIEPASAGLPVGIKSADKAAPRKRVTAKAGCESIALVPDRVPHEVLAPLRDRPEIDYPGMRRVAAPPVRPSACRAEELGVIERFLAERGATRCPDVATIQRSPLPTLVWDKMKRKWVRPPHPLSEREAS